MNDNVIKNGDVVVSENKQQQTELTKKQEKERNDIVNYLISKKYKEVSPNTFEGEINKHVSFHSFYVPFKFTIKFEKPQKDNENEDYKFDNSTNTFIIRKGVRKFRFFFDGEEYKLASQEFEKDLARLKEIGFDSFVKEKAPQQFKDEQWRELFLELINKSREEIKEEAKTKWPNSFSDWITNWIKNTIPRPNVDDESEGWYERKQEYDWKRKKFEELYSQYHYQWEKYQESLRKQEINKILEQIKTEKGSKYEELANRHLDNQLELKEAVEEVETDIKNLFPNLDTKDRDWGVAEKFFAEFLSSIEKKRREARIKEKQGWTDQQWKDYWPSPNPIIENNVSFELQETAKQGKEFIGICQHCKEMGETTFKLMFQTKRTLIYVCSRCENTEYYINKEKK